MGQDNEGAMIIESASKDVIATGAVQKPKVDTDYLKSNHANK